ncbi:MAG: ammonium transporter [Candidatus Adiutrix sp.]|nr:ammonium transporter [Candidatus Adiutrix sp.]
MFAANTGFMIICSALVFLMLPGLALFYGGLVQNRNILSTTMHSLILLGVGSVFWAVIGYSLAFGTDHGGVIGGLDYFLLNGVGQAGDGPVDTIPHVLFMIYQCMFTCLTPALISGAYAERIKFPAMVMFSLLWLFLVYAPLAHWVWGGGWLAQYGALDFAGGAVVHMSSGAAALAAAHALGRRKALESGEVAPHNLPLTILGAGLLWFGWFGFNAGSATAASPLAANALATTQLSTAAAMVGWLAVELFHRGQISCLGAASGALAGLVAITPAAGFVTPMASLPIGFIGGAVCYGGVILKQLFKYDDALDVVGIHGIGGTWGALATGIWATVTVNPDGADGLLYGHPGQLWIQFVSVVATWVFCYLASRLIFKIVACYTPLRAAEAEESTGLDLVEHNERAYQF